MVRSIFGISCLIKEFRRPSDRPQPSPIQTYGSSTQGSGANTPISATISGPGEAGLKKLGMNGDAAVDQEVSTLLRAACQRVLTLAEQRVSGSA